MEAKEIGLGGSGGESEAFADQSDGGASSFNSNVGGESEAFADHFHDGASSSNTDVGGESEAFDDHSHDGASSFNTDVGGEREAFADHSHDGVSSFNNDVGGESEAFADHSRDGASSFNTDVGAEEYTAVLRQALEDPFNDAMLSEIAEEVFHREYQSILRYGSKMSDFLVELQRPKMDEAAVTAKASDLIIALDAAMLSACRFVKFSRTKLQTLLADLEKVDVAIPDLSRLEKPDVSTFKFEIPVEPTELEALITGVEELEISIPVVEAKIANLKKKLMDPINLRNTLTLSREEMESFISDVKAKIMAFEKQAVDLGAKMEEATED